MTKRFLQIAIFLGGTLFLFQNCSQTQFASVASPANKAQDGNAGGSASGTLVSPGTSGDANGSLTSGTNQPSSGQIPDEIAQCQANGQFNVVSGSGGRTIIYQSNTSNVASSVQVGSNNFVQITQNGSDNLACVCQSGSGNMATINQTGHGNVAIIYQGGSAGSAGDVASQSDECLCELLSYCSSHSGSTFCQSLQ